MAGNTTNSGMCFNPFGGHLRLDKLDIFDGAKDGTGLELLFRNVILEAAQSYLFWGLGRNGTVADEFLWASDYFFAVTPDNPETWNPERKICIDDMGAGGWRNNPNYRTISLDDSEMAALCFDIHYQASELARHMTISTFRRLLQKKRRNIVEANIEQIKQYLRVLRSKAASRGEFIKAGTKAADFIQTLVKPSPGALACLIYPSKPVEQVDSRKVFRMPLRVNGRRSWASVRLAA